MMKAHPYSFLTLILITLAFLFSGQAIAADIDAKLPDSDNASSFQVKDSADTVLMKVQSGGNVGIGTDSPNSLLDIDDSSNPYVSLSKGGTRFGHINVDSDGKMRVGTDGAHDLILFTQDGQDVTIQSGGNVGIGTDDPNSTLQVNGSFSARYSSVSFSGSTTTYDVLDTDFIIGVTSLAQTGTINLPSATSANVGRIITIKNETSEGESTIQLEVSPASGDTIDNLATSDSGYLSAWGFIRLYSNGSNHWLAIGGEFNSGS